MIERHLNQMLQITQFVEPRIYQLAGYFMASMMDDPAMLAFAFC